jgi:hypothetical protein
VFFALCLTACSKEPKFVAQQFVGVWKSSRLASRPLHLLANGDWEIRSGSDASPLQYGVWQVDGKAILWTYRVNGNSVHDRNPIVSAEPHIFVLREKDGSLTRFDRLEK